MEKKRLICIDFDGVIHEYTGWEGDSLKGPLPGAKEFIQEILDKGLDINIYTTREASQIKDWLKKNNFPNIEVSNSKPAAYCYIDDRAIKFDGDFEKLKEDFKNFKVYWKKE